MNNLNHVEKARLIEQERLDALKSAGERNRWGQFATPPALADQIMRYARSLTGAVRFLDPAIGTGSFYSALLKVFESERIVGATGIELDPGFARSVRQLWKHHGLEVTEADFTALQPQPAFNLLVSNPPYVRHHHLSGAQKKHLQHRILLEHGIRISGLAGLYCYFLLLADSWLQEDGLAIWLIPSEFMDVNYGFAVKRYLTDRVRLLRIHRFCPADVQFTDALVSSTIVVFRKGPPAREVQMSFGGSLLSPNRTSVISLDTLRNARKWTALPAAESGAPTESRQPTLGDLFTIKRGIATGSNSFFILPEEEAVRQRIPEECRRPILPNPRQLSSGIVEADERGCPSNTVRLTLIDCGLPEDQVKDRFPCFWQYLQRGKAEKMHASYLASRRHPWYSQEKRDPAPFLFTYMGRSGEGRKPFRVIWNRSAATAHNVYLLLYPKGAVRRILHERPELQRVVFEQLCSIDTGKLLDEGRVYGGGLHKLEPRELSRVPAQTIWEALVGSSVFPEALQPKQLALAWQ